jgi:hypothetical protein
MLPRHLPPHRTPPVGGVTGAALGLGNVAFEFG